MGRAGTVHGPARLTRGGQVHRSWAGALHLSSHQLPPDRPVSAWSVSLFKGSLPPNLKFSIIFGTSLLFIPATCRGQLDLHNPSFSPAGSDLNSSKISSFLLWSKRVHPAVLLKNLIPVDVSRVYPFFLRVQISLPYRRMGRFSALYSFILENLWTKFCLKLLFRISSIWENFDSFCWIIFSIFIGHFTS